MPKAIIFGVTGQDGSHLSDLLLEKGYDVVGVSRRCSVDNTERIKHLGRNDKFDLIQGDITDAHSVVRILLDHADVDEIYNLAAQSHVGVSFKQPGLTWDITGKGCMNILQAMVDIGCRAKFYQASSSEMFGSNYDVNYIIVESDTVKNGVAHEPEQIKFQDENTKFLPQSPYAIAKCAAHYMTRLYREAYGIHASSGILFNHEGPRRGENFVTRKITKWIGEYVRWRGQHSEYPIKFCNRTDSIIAYNFGDEYEVHGTFPKLRLGNLDAFRDWGYSGDYVEAMWMMLQQDRPDDYVICTGETHTIRDFLDVAFEAAGIGGWDNYVTIDPEFYRPAEVDYLRGINKKAKEQLGWEPRHSFEDLVKLMVEHDVNEDL